MGGIGSGARRSTRIGNLEDTLALDIRALRRLGVVCAGECRCSTLHWPVGAPEAFSARLRADLSDMERGGVLMVAGNMPGGAINQKIAIELVPAPLGGHRCYFICPVNRRRCEVLHYAQGRFASRQAQRLAYATQGMDAIGRARRKAAKLRQRLNGLGGQPRPRGRTRIIIAERLHEAEGAARMLYFDRLSTLARQSGAHRMPGRSD